MRRLLFLHALLVYLFLYLPILVIAALSFNESRRGVRFTGFTLDWYRALFQDPRVLEYFLNTLVVAFTSTLVSTVLGTLLALGLVRYRFWGRGFLTYLLYIPVVVPDVVMGVSLLLLFAFARELLGFPRLSLLTVILGHITFQVAFVTLVVRSRLLLLDPALEEAARDLGARGLQTFLYVTLPLAWPGVAAGALLALTLSLDDFVVTFFTAGPGATTLPLYIYSSVKLGVSPKVHALSTLLVGFSAFFLALGYALSRRRL
jgi:spermidine/putrescine transport system permease protein